MKRTPYSYSTFPDVYWKTRLKCEREDTSISKLIHGFLVEYVKDEPALSDELLASLQMHGLSGHTRENGDVLQHDPDNEKVPPAEESGGGSKEQLTDADTSPDISKEPDPLLDEGDNLGAFEPGKQPEPETGQPNGTSVASEDLLANSSATSQVDEEAELLKGEDNNLGALQTVPVTDEVHVPEGEQEEPNAAIAGNLDEQLTFGEVSTPERETEDETGFEGQESEPVVITLPVSKREKRQPVHASGKAKPVKGARLKGGKAAILPARKAATKAASRLNGKKSEAVKSTKKAR